MGIRPAPFRGWGPGVRGLVGIGRVLHSLADVVRRSVWVVGWGWRIRGRKCSELLRCEGWVMV